MPTFGHGRSARVLADGLLMHDYLTSVEVGATADTAETTVFNSSQAKAYVPGNKDATISAEGLFDGDPAAIESVIDTALGTSEVIWTYFPQGDTTGNYGFGLKTRETAYGITSPVDGVVSMSVEGQSFAGRDRVKSLKSLASVSSSGNSANDDNTSATTKGGVGYLQRTSTGTKTVTATIQHSSAATSWAALVSFSAASNRQAQRIAASGSVKRYLRAAWTLSTGGTGSPAIQVSFNRKT